MALVMNVTADGGIWSRVGGGGCGMKLCGLRMTQHQSSGSGSEDALCEADPEQVCCFSCLKGFSERR